MQAVKINQLEIENVKRIKAVLLTPTQNGLTIIGGNNNQGKTSVLDTIAWALGGDRYRPSRPEREGSVIPPRIKLTLSNGLVVERSGKNSALKVTDPSGQRAGQQLLNSFVEELALNLPKFMECTGKEKADTLLRIIGVGEQVTALEFKEKQLYNQRLAIGRIADQKAKYAKELPFYSGVPERPVSAMELIQRQQAILARNGENQRKREQAARLTEKVDTLTRRMAELTAELEAAKRDLAVAQMSAQELHDESVAQIEQDLREIDLLNIKVRANLDREKAEEEATAYSEQYDSMTAELEQTRKAKYDLLNGAKLPLEGLSVEDGELTFHGMKWDAMSGSDQLRVSTAIVRALKPSCGFVLLDKLEQMDLNTLEQFGAWLEEQGLQAIATRVSTGGECSVIIEDGENATPLNSEKSWKDGF
nr:MAG TPA: STRUCTURAL MAINTENANCE OF CHROMOSOMES PROTEIN [Caudoviricetes sp.]